MLGLGQPRVGRERLTQTTPRALSQSEQRQLLRAAERAGARDRALAGVMLFAALQISEAVALDLDDLRLCAREGEVSVRSSTAAGRAVALNAVICGTLCEWLAERRAPDAQTALFVTRHGGRLSARAADDAIRKLTADANLEISAQVLRHTCLANLAAGGETLKAVSELAGHRRLDTTLRYYPPAQTPGRAATGRAEADD